MMAAEAAVRSSVGLVTAFAPASAAASLAAQVPEAMWVPWPETNDGSLAPDAIDLLLKRANQATALLIGPGMGNFDSTRLLAHKILTSVDTPTLLDADALHHEVISSILSRQANSAPIILTPHLGEFLRITKLPKSAVSNKALKAFCRQFQAITVLKGPYTRISDGAEVWYNVRGGPVLARGGSGDLLAGLIGGLVARKQLDVHSAIACGVLLHGMAAEQLAREKGQNCVHTRQLLDYLPDVIRATNSHVG